MEKEKRLQKSMKQGEKFEVWWVDTFSRQGWYSEEQVIEEAKANSFLNKTVGYFIKRAYGYFIFSMSDCPVLGFNRWGIPKYIPEKTIKKIRKIG